MRTRVIQWATGGVGRAAIEGILDHPELELVGCWVHSADKNGRDIGEIAGRGPIGCFYPFATQDVSEMKAACRMGCVTLHVTGIHPGGAARHLTGAAG